MALATLDLDTLMTENDELYDIFNLSREALQQEITAAYKRLQRDCHPDRVSRDSDSQKDANERVCTVVKIYDMLGNQEKRKKYDDEGLDAVVAEVAKANTLQAILKIADKYFGDANASKLREWNGNDDLTPLMDGKYFDSSEQLVKLESGESIVLLKEVESLHFNYTSEFKALLKAGNGHQKPALKKLNPHSARYADWWHTIDKHEFTHEEKKLLARCKRTIEWTEVADHFKKLERLQGRSVTELKIAENRWKTCVKSYGFPRRWDQMVQEKFMSTTMQYPQSSFQS
ncbi:hypothetical protein LTR49_025817 [Elasticomyces elasticus]|nr:hypothetical protein LTR49_025817 [Elasticomyces elasticus]